jgi:hypothetical protein
MVQAADRAKGRRNSTAMALAPFLDFSLLWLALSR